MAIDLITAIAEDFDPFINQTFHVETPGGLVDLILDNVKRFENSMVRDSHVEIDGVVYPPRKAFALTFVGPREPVLKPLTYRIHNDNTGVMELLLSAFRQDHDCMLYECSFN